MSWVLLAIALATGAAGLLIGLPAWRAWQSRAAQDRNAERYLAWRGRADDTGGGSAQRMTSDERRRIGMAAALLAIAIVCLVIGLSS